MKKFIIISLFLVGCGGSGSSELTKNTIDISPVEPVIEPVNATLNVIHRGYDDNKISGFESAINDGFTVIEADVRLRNGELILLHDDVPECLECNTLRELLYLTQMSGVTLWLELKEAHIVNDVLNEVSEYSVDIVLFSFNTDVLIELNSASNYPLGLVANDDSELGKVSGIVDWLVIPKAKIDLCSVNHKCGVWTIHNQAEHDMVNGKVDAIVMDKF